MIDKPDIKDVTQQWADIGVDLLRRATGVEWKAEVEVDLWDSHIRFINQNDPSFPPYQTADFEFDGSPESNFRLMLYGVMQIIREWEKQKKARSGFIIVDIPLPDGSELL